MARNGMGNEGNGSNQHLHSIVARARPPAHCQIVPNSRAERIPDVLHTVRRLRHAGESARATLLHTNIHRVDLL